MARFGLRPWCPWREVSRCDRKLMMLGSHRKWFNPQTQRATVVPDWGAKDLKLGTLRAVVRQLGIEWSSFQDV